MSTTPATDKQRTRNFPLASAVRLLRLQAGLTLQDVATEVGLNLHRASIIERFPERARPGELERLVDAIDAISERRQPAAGAEKAR